MRYSDSFLCEKTRLYSQRAPWLTDHLLSKLDKPLSLSAAKGIYRIISIISASILCVYVLVSVCVCVATAPEDLTQYLEA